MVGAGILTAGIGLISIFTIEEANRQKAAHQEAERAAVVREAANPIMIERAKELIGKDFLGIEAVRNMESKLKGVGINVEFLLNNLPSFLYYRGRLTNS